MARKPWNSDISPERPASEPRNLGASERTDAQLIAAAQAGDSGAFAILYNRHADWTSRLATHWIHRQDAADIMQDAFMWVLLRMPNLQLRSRFRTVLFQVVRNLCRGVRRRRMLRQAAKNLSELADQGQEPGRHDDLTFALMGLPPEQRDVVTLHYIDGLTLVQVAARQHVPLGTVKSRLNQSLRALHADPRSRRYFLP